VVCLSKLFSRTFDLLPLRSTWVCYLCMQGSLPCLWSSTKATHQGWFVLEVKRSLKLFLQVLCATPVWPVIPTGLTGALCESQWAIDLTGYHHRSDWWTLTAQVFGEEKFKSVVSPIRPPLGDIKVLSWPPFSWFTSLPVNSIIKWSIWRNNSTIISLSVYTRWRSHT
jgi:hypothetical protein